MTEATKFANVRLRADGVTFLSVFCIQIHTQGLELLLALAKKAKHRAQRS
jgi:hypothetical protein